MIGTAQPQVDTRTQIARKSRRDQVLAFFSAHIGESFPTADLHVVFGSAFRTRTSELNRDPDCPIRVHNHTERSPDGQETSFYWAAWRIPQEPSVETAGTFPEFGDLSPRERYPE